MSIRIPITTCAQRNHSTAADSERPRRGPRPRVPFAAGSLAALAVAALSLVGATAHARSGFQGPRLLDSALGDAEIQDNWMQGPYLAGFLADGRPVAITDFAGSVIRAVDLAAVDGAPETIELDREDLVGLQWTARLCLDGDAGGETPCHVITYRVAAAAADSSLSTMPLHQSNRDVALYELQYTLGDPKADDWTNPCAHPGSDSPMGMFVNGRWGRDGSWTPGGYTFSCTGGTIAKCARGWGYKPWKVVLSPTRGPVRLASLHQACVRAARADYCGDGDSHTVADTLVDLVDSYGLNPPEPELRFAAEAGFDTGGAVWARHPRIVGQKAEASAPLCRGARRSELRGDRAGSRVLIEVRSRPAPAAQP